MSHPLFQDISEKLIAKIQVINAPGQFDLGKVKNGLVAIHADWSGYSVMMAKSILQILDDSPRNDFEIIILDINKLNPEQQMEYLGFDSRGYFEGVWIENGQVLCKNEYGKGIESFHQFKLTIFELAGKPKAG